MTGLKYNAKSLEKEGWVERKSVHTIFYPLLFEKCPVCGRKMIIQMANCGDNDAFLGVTVICADCLKKTGINKEYSEMYDYNIEKIQKYINEEAE